MPYLIEELLPFVYLKIIFNSLGEECINFREPYLNMNWGDGYNVLRYKGVIALSINF